MNTLHTTAIKHIIGAALMASDQPLTVERLMALFDRDGPPDTLRDENERALAALAEDYAGRGIEIIQVARGWLRDFTPHGERDLALV
ncbi:MAG: SMC-Scp complex subunit ScpB [Gammaproteobacteria bacterium]